MLTLHTVTHRNGSGSVHGSLKNSVEIFFDRTLKTNITQPDTSDLLNKQRAKFFEPRDASAGKQSLETFNFTFFPRVRKRRENFRHKTLDDGEKVHHLTLIISNLIRCTFPSLPSIVHCTWFKNSRKRRRHSVCVNHRPFLSIPL